MGGWWWWWWVVLKAVLVKSFWAQSKLFTNQTSRNLEKWRPQRLNQCYHVLLAKIEMLENQNKFMSWENGWSLIPEQQDPLAQSNCQICCAVTDSDDSSTSLAAWSSPRDSSAPWSSPPTTSSPAVASPPSWKTSRREPLQLSWIYIAEFLLPPPIRYLRWESY